MTLARRVAFALSAAAACALVSGGAQATAPGENGRIAFERYRFSDTPLWSEIWVVDPDGTGERRVSHAPRGLLDRGPDWAPDGSRIVFQRCPPSAGRCTIWVTKPDGAGEKMLTPPCGRRATCHDDAEPAYSPDGKSIAFSRDVGHLTIADADLHHPRRIAPFGNARGVPSMSAPAWSPGGKRLAVVVTNDNGRRFEPLGGRAIFVVGVDGRGLRRITPWRLKAGGGPENIDWSPDGTRILFRTQPLPSTDSGGNLYTVRPDGTGLRQLTHFESYDPSPGAMRNGSFSPDGSSIVFATYHGAVTGGGCCNLPDVFVMSSDGTDVRPVTRSRNWDGDPDWGPG